MSSLLNDEWELSFPPALSMRRQSTFAQEAIVDNLDLNELTFNDGSSFEIDEDILNFNLFALSEKSSVSQFSAENAPFQRKESETLAITQFANLNYNRCNIGVLVTGFMALQSRTYSMYIPSDIHPIVFQFYYEEENEVLHFSEKVFRTLMINSSSPSTGEFTGNQLVDAVAHCVRDEPAEPKMETLVMSHKLLRLKYIELVAYVSSFSSLFSVNLLRMDDDFDEKHRYKFAANRIDQYAYFASSESESD